MTAENRDTRHELLPVDDGTHVIIFQFDGMEYVFERKVFIPATEYRTS